MPKKASLKGGEKMSEAGIPIDPRGNRVQDNSIKGHEGLIEDERAMLVESVRGMRALSIRVP